MVTAYVSSMQYIKPHCSLPLFFVVVKTNVNYQAVASFVDQDETTPAITEALRIIKVWAPEWHPKCFMVDNCDEEIKSIGKTFPRL